MPSSLLLGLALPVIVLLTMIIYKCLNWYLSPKGLSPSELDKLPKVSGRELVMETECVVCLEGIGEEQLARVLPGCKHSFHLECIDTWLSIRPHCPICRALVRFSTSSEMENP